MPARRSVMIAAAAAFAPTLALAQNFPSRPVRIYLPVAPGGITDLAARLVAEKLQQSTGQPWLIEHRPGGNTKLAVHALKTAAPDGYSLLAANPPVINNIHLSRSAGYRLEDFVPVSLLYLGPLSLSVSKSVPATNIQELIAYIKANPGKVNFASVGAGGTTQLLARLLEQQYGLQMVDIPYKGGAAALQALMAGDIAIYFDAVTTSLPLHKAGNIRIMGITSEERMKGAPDLPTLKEQGINITSSSWNGLFAPAGTPRAAVDAIHREVVKAVASPEFQSRMIEGAQIPMASASPDEFKRFVQSESDKWGRLIKALNLQTD